MFDIFQELDSCKSIICNFQSPENFCRHKFDQEIESFFFANNFWFAPFGYLYFHFLYVIASIAYIHPVYSAGV